MPSIRKPLRMVLLILLPLITLGQPSGQVLDGLRNTLNNAENDTTQMEAFLNLGAYYSLEDRDSSSYYLEKAYGLSTRLGQKLSEASILNLLGVLQMQQEKYAKSLEYYLKAIHIAKDPSIEGSIRGVSTGQSPFSVRMLQLSRSYDLIGLLNAYTGNWTDNINNQMKNYQEAGKYADASGDKHQIATVIFHKGIAYMNAGKLDSALVYLGEARSRFSEVKDPQLGRAYIYTGEAYAKMGDLKQAAFSVSQALALLNQTNDNVHRGLGYLSLGRIYAASGKTDSALYCAGEGFRIFEKRKDPAWKRDAANLLANCFDRMGRSDSATFYVRLAKSLTDSLSIEERKNLLAFQDVLIEEQAKLEKLEKEKIEAREKMRIYLLVSGIVVFSVVALLLYRNNLVRRKTNEMLHQRNLKIEHTLDQLRSAQAQLIQSEKMASLGELTAGIAHEIQNPLNFVNNFSETGSELLDEMKEKIRLGDYGEVSSIADDVKQNLERIHHHGKRADSIVKGMLQHSGRSTGQKELININSICEEYLRLAYHGFQAKHKDLDVQLVTELDPALPKAYVVPQDMGRVVLNLLNNAFYAVQKRAELDRSSGNLTYEPKIFLRTVTQGDRISIAVGDNGMGIPEAIIDKVFQPFFTTKPTGQGTGLGLSLAYDIVKAHSGGIKAESKEGLGSTFFVEFPLS